ncbi:hypothetical protein [Mesorhizobium loti]
MPFDEANEPLYFHGTIGWLEQFTVSRKRQPALTVCLDAIPVGKRYALFPGKPFHAFPGIALGAAAEQGWEMKLPSTGANRVTLLVTLLVVGGCASLGKTVDPKYDKMTCTELNSALGTNAGEISQTAITRGKVANTSVPRWLLGGERVKTGVANRETTRIERLQQEQQTLIAARKSRCASSQ